MFKKEALHARSEAIADPKQACTRRDAPLCLVYQATITNHVIPRSFRVTCVSAKLGGP